MADAFWENKTLEQMSDDEWESLCDGCARCCLLKLEDMETQKLYFTNVSCQLLDNDRCQCSDYANRLQRVPECLQVRLMKADEYEWLPRSCAYRRLAEGRPLADWHPLISGDPNSVFAAGISVAGRAISETYIHTDQLENHIIDLSDD